jgi:WD40 repeat protein
VASINLRANVCSVQFAPHSPHLLAAGAANGRIYLYDLRQLSRPLALLPSHGRAVSYVRFLSQGLLVSASTDSALRLWALDRATPSALAAAASSSLEGGPDGSPPCVRTYRGHVNERNFTGLSVSPEGYIATGSEENRLVCYHQCMPLPVASYDFSGSPGGGAGGGGGGSSGGAADGGALGPLGVARAGWQGQGGPAAGPGVAPPSLFVSSVAWSRRGGYLLSGNSVGAVKLLTLS